MRDDEALELAREVITGKTRSYVDAAIALAKHLLNKQEAEIAERHGIHPPHSTVPEKMRAQQGTIPSPSSHTCQIGDAGKCVACMLGHPPNQALGADALHEATEEVPSSEPPSRHILGSFRPRYDPEPDDED
jgi:hypothetical protein